MDLMTRRALPSFVFKRYSTSYTTSGGRIEPLLASDSCSDSVTVDVCLRSTVKLKENWKGLISSDMDKRFSPLFSPLFAYRRPSVDRPSYCFASLRLPSFPRWP